MSEHHVGRDRQASLKMSQIPSNRDQEALHRGTGAVETSQSIPAACQDKQPHILQPVPAKAPGWAGHFFNRRRSLGYAAESPKWEFPRGLNMEPKS